MQLTHWDMTLEGRILSSGSILVLRLNAVEPSGVQALKNPNPLKDVEALAVLGVAVLV